MSFTIRGATAEDLDQLYAVMTSAFGGSELDSRVWPATDPRTVPDQFDGIKRGIHEITVAEDSNGVIQGWSRWTRREANLPRNIVKPEDFPETGDRDLAVRFFQSNSDKSRAAARGEAYWFLSIMVVRPEAQRKGVGRALMEEGLRVIDEKGGLAAIVNASKAGLGLYERYGFRTVEDSPFEHGIHSFHMRREPMGRTETAS